MVTDDLQSGDFPINNRTRKIRGALSYYGRLLVEAAGVEPASENIPLQFLRVYPLF